MVIITEEMKKAFDTIILEAEKQAKDNSDAEMVVVAQTAKDNIYTCVNHNITKNDYDEMDSFLQMLVDTDDVEIKYCVCMWTNGGLEPPFYHLRKGLLELSPKNEATIFCGHGENTLVLKSLKDMQPL